MKRVLQLILLMAFFLNTGIILAGTHVYDLRTGVTNTNQLIPYYQPDDNWTVKKPNSSTFFPAFCGSGIPTASSAPYIGKDPSVRWICPQEYMISNGKHDANAPIGFYEYKYTFYLEPCGVESAQFTFNHIGGDNEIQTIYVNGNPYPVSYTYLPFTNNVTVTIQPGDITWGTNTIIFELYNDVGASTVESFTGIEVNGDLTIVDNGSTANFWLTSTNGQIQGYSTDNGNHTWKVYCAGDGSGPYSLAATFFTSSFSMDVTCDCYYVSHTSGGSCGETCSAQSLCTFECGDKKCNLSSPVGLSRLVIDPNTHQFSWNPVTGAASYILELTLGDPACCGWPDPDEPMQAPPVVTIPVNSTSVTVDISQLPWTIDLSEKCYSWRVYAICPDGTPSLPSVTKCSNYTGPPMDRIGDPNNENMEVLEQGKTGVMIYPNPANETVMFDIRSEDDREVSITVFDITGKTVRTFGGLRTTGGSVRLGWDAGSLDRGVYLVRIWISDSDIITRKLVLK